MNKWGKSPSSKEQAAHMAMRKVQNIDQSRHSKAEEWMYEKLKHTGHKWSRQAVWGWRVYDFWCHELGIAVEVDGPEHDISYDAKRDAYNWKRSRIIVLRVNNFDEDDARKTLKAIATAQKWNERREAAGLSIIRT